MATHHQDDSTHAGLTVRETHDAHGNTQYAVYDHTGLSEISTSINGLSAQARQAWARQQGKTDEEINHAGQNLPKY